MKRIICWDLDRTIGSFLALEAEAFGMPLKEYMERYEFIDECDPQFDGKALGLRYGISHFLAKSKQQYNHVITSNKGLTHVNNALRKTEISDHFNHVFAGDDLRVGLGEKNYNKVASFYSLNNTAGQNMIVIGDVPGDQPQDLGDVVFIYEPSAYQFDVRVTELILQKLSACKDDDFAEGFRRWHSSLIPQPDGIAKLEHGQRSGDARFATLENNLTLILNYDRDKAFPIIEVINSDNYAKPIQIISR